MGLDSAFSRFLHSDWYCITAGSNLCTNSVLPDVSLHAISPNQEVSHNKKQITNLKVDNNSLSHLQVSSEDFWSCFRSVC